MRLTVLTLSLVLSASTLGAWPSRTETVTWSGWFSDKGCAESKLKAEEVTPNGSVCVKKCLDDGATPVFVNPATRTLYDVKDHASVKEDVGFYLELTGVVDEAAKTVSVRSVKRLGDVMQMCARPAKKTS